MAADTRPYKSKEQDGQGNEVIIRDQQLVEQSTVTTMPSGACFETLDIDGRPVKIPRDNMMSIVLECIGIVLNDSSKNLGTNVNKALGLQGNTIGNVTVNDFASVLGVTIYTMEASDLNNPWVNNYSADVFRFKTSANTIGEIAFRRAFVAEGSTAAPIFAVRYFSSHWSPWKILS